MIQGFQSIPSVVFKARKSAHETLQDDAFIKYVSVTFQLYASW
jgi:hypothetical protein